MLRYIVRRLAQLVVVLLILSLLLFFWLRLLPGGPDSAICGERCTPEQRTALRSAMGLDQPIWTQYLKYLGRIVQGDFGTSGFVEPGVPALQAFWHRLPATIELTIAALIFALVLAIPLGYFAARRKGSLLDNLGVVVSLLGVAVPVFFLAYLLKFIFAVKLHWLPDSGRQSDINATRVTGFFVLDGLLTREWDAAWDALKHLILPAIALGFIPFAVIFRITRGSVIDVQNEDYVRTAESKGLTTAVIRRRHILRNALLPVVTVTGLQVGALLAGAVLTETVFAYPGLGQATQIAFQNRDYAMLQILVLASAVTYMLVNLVVDLSYALIDPRIRTR